MTNKRHWSERRDLMQAKVWGAVLAVMAALTLPIGVEAGDAARGKYLFDAAGCLGCHTDTKNKGIPLTGGRAFKTPFGVFYSPNITPDRETGIGTWTDDDFVRAIRNGVSPDREHYYPVFPYASFTGMSLDDILDLKAYLFSTPAIAKANRAHDLDFPFSWRFVMTGWKLLFFRTGPFEPDPKRSAEWNRGAYLVEALGHCAECHTPRNRFGGLDRDFWLAGTKTGPEGGIVPNITPDKETGIGTWTESDLANALKIGMLPDGDFVGEGMAEFVENSGSRLNDNDIKAINAYLKALPPISNVVKTKTQSNSSDDW